MNINKDDLIRSFHAKVLACTDCLDFKSIKNRPVPPYFGWDTDNPYNIGIIQNCPRVYDNMGPFNFDSGKPQNEMDTMIHEVVESIGSSDADVYATFVSKCPFRSSSFSKTVLSKCVQNYLKSELRQKIPVWIITTQDKEYYSAIKSCMPGKFKSRDMFSELMFIEHYRYDARNVRYIFTKNPSRVNSKENIHVKWINDLTNAILGRDR